MGGQNYFKSQFGQLLDSAIFHLVIHRIVKFSTGLLVIIVMQISIWMSKINNIKILFFDKALFRYSGANFCLDRAHFMY